MKLLKIIEVIESFTDESITVKTRKRHIVSLRWIYYKIARELTKHSLQRIGSTLNKNHATVLHGLKMFDVVIKERDYQLLYEKCKRFLSELPVDDTATITDVIDYYEALISELKFSHQEVKNHEKQELYETILGMDESTFKMFDETRLKPFLKMHKVA